MKAISANILLLAFDDDPDQLELFDYILKENGVERYVLVYTREDFYKNLNSDINLIIVDHLLGGITGLEIIKDAKERNKGNYAMVVSSIQDFDVAVDYINAGADWFVKKTGDYEEYKRRLNEGLRRGFIVARERIENEREKAEREREKSERMQHYTDHIIGIIDKGQK